MHSASPLGASLMAWNETGVGATGDEALVERDEDMLYVMLTDLICRTAGYVTRTSGGVGGRGREASSYPDRQCIGQRSQVSNLVQMANP